MAHWSENSRKLEQSTIEIDDLSLLKTVKSDEPVVYLFWLPSKRTSDDAANSKDAFSMIAESCGKLNEESTVCVLTTPPDAAMLLPHLEKSLRFQLWIAVKKSPDSYTDQAGMLPDSHAALLVLTRYKKTLVHTKTRIKYTYCPACGKTTKDYGGKKHTYHEYGTLMSDVWRDVECDPGSNIDVVADRLRDLFGLKPYEHFFLIDLRECEKLLPQSRKQAAKSSKSFNQEPESGIRLDSQLMNEDCLEALASLPDDSVDFCFADPPYNLNKKYDRWDDAIESVRYFDWCDKWLSELCRVLKPSRTLAVLNIPLWAVRHYQHVISMMNFQSWIAWESLGFPVRMIMPAHYAILCFSKGSPRPLPGLSDFKGNIAEEACLKPLKEFYCLRATCIARRRSSGKSDCSAISDIWHDIHRLKHNSRRVDHPCQLPPLLMRRLFALFTNPGEIILDCFDGAGTSTLVARQMNRSFIGIELSQQYHEIALQRHEQIELGGDPFGKADRVLTAKNSPVQRLPRQKYEVAKKDLQMDVKRIARQLGHIPTKKEVEALSKFPIEYFDKYFTSWGEVCAAARTTGMTELPQDKPLDSGQLELFFDTAKQ
jgi:site-specific DNA-methyltransferase (adenine-specific)